MNKVILMGRLVSDPRIRQARETTVANFTIAVDRRGEGTDFPSCVAFGKTADFAEKYLRKGMKVAIEGRLQTGSYTDTNDVKHYTTDVIVENVEFAESKKASEEARPKEEKADGDGFLKIPEDGVDLPFV